MVEQILSFFLYFFLVVFDLKRKILAMKERELIACDIVHCLTFRAKIYFYPVEAIKYIKFNPTWGALISFNMLTMILQVLVQD